MNRQTKLMLGVVLLVVSFGLGYWGLQISGSLESQINEFVRGSPTDKVMYLYIGGAVSFVVGVFLLIKR